MLERCFRCGFLVLGACSLIFASGLTQADKISDGRDVYYRGCYSCHNVGFAGAPKIGDHADWAPRIAQGLDVLFERALRGFQGKSGYMPPKGGFSTLTESGCKGCHFSVSIADQWVYLSDDEVKAAVLYMVDQAQLKD